MFDHDPLPVSDILLDDDLLELDRLVDTHNMERTGIEDAKLVSTMLRSDEGALFAGLHGYTWGGYCEVKSLWVAPDRRGKGLGRSLLGAAEREAVARGCRLALLTTHSFQARDFYLQLGYRQLASVDNCPIGHSYLLMAKALPRNRA